MKLTLFTLLLPMFSFGQKTALLSTDFKTPIIYTDSVTAEQVGHSFPVNMNDFDTLYANLEYLDKMINIRQRAKMQSFELHSGNVVIKISRVPFSNGDRYIMKAISSAGNIQSVLNLSDVNQSNKRNSKNLEKLMAYMKSNKSLFKEPYGIQPKIYNVVVISE